MPRSNFYRLGAATRQDGLIETVFDCLPKRLCRDTLVYTKDGQAIDERVVQAVMSAIRLGWIAARKTGSASVIWEDTTLKVRYGGMLRSSRSARRQRDRAEGYVGYPLFGYQEFPQYNYGETIATVELFEAVCAYRQVLQYLAGRVKNSYARMMILAGELSVDMADLVREKIDQDFEKEHSIQAPEGSNLIGSQVSLTDLNTAMQPFRERIAHEAGLPIWLIFPDLVSTKYELENRADYLRTEFDTHVKPAVIGVFDLMGSQVQVETPTFRDRFFEAEIVDKVADAEYKRSATDQNDNAVALSRKEFALKLKAMRSGTDEQNVPIAPKPRKGRRR